MADRSWMLNRSAIASAKACIEIVKEELGVQLKLSHPEFIEIIAEYCELTESEALTAAYLALLAFTDTDAGYANIAVMPRRIQSKAEPKPSAPSLTEQVQYHGKDYPRFDASGKEFQGLYRGAARYG
ncbi:MAG: hypothetical protein WCY88_15605 [Spongiibacteraceae bacterium]